MRNIKPRFRERIHAVSDLLESKVSLQSTKRVPMEYARLPLNPCRKVAAHRITTQIPCFLLHSLEKDCLDMFSLDFASSTR